MLSVTNLSSGYGHNLVLDRVSLELARGEIVALIGANGAGKSTLLNTIMGLVPARGGDVSFAGIDLRRLRTQAIVGAGLVQVPERRQLFGTMTVLENLLMGAHIRGDRKAIGHDLQVQFARFPILGQRRSQLARSLSGGEQQMLAIARALMSRPKAVLLDEPTLGLAPLLIRQVLDIVVAIRDSGGSVLLVEQNALAALEIADRAYVMETGRMKMEGSSASLMNDPSVRAAYLGGGNDGGGMEARIRELRNEVAEAGMFRSHGGDVG